MSKDYINAKIQSLVKKESLITFYIRNAYYTNVSSKKNISLLDIMPNKIFILILICSLTSCATQKHNYIALPKLQTSSSPIKIHYTGANPPAIVFVKDSLPQQDFLTPDYIPYGNSYWWWH